MKFYDKYFSSSYEELITYYPRFYKDVFEMVEILKAHGRIADELEENIEQTFYNSFIDYADEATIAKLEKFLGIGLNRTRSLEERRRLIKSFFVGFGKVSASMLAGMIRSYTGAEVESKFEPFDSQGNNMLYLYFQRGREPTLYMSDINLLLDKKIPAHIKWQAAVTYNWSVGIGIKRRHYKTNYELCGTKPEIEKIGTVINSAVITKILAKNYGAEQRQASASEELSGRLPEISLIGSISSADGVISACARNYTLEHETAAREAKMSGEMPKKAWVGRANTVNVEADVKAVSYEAAYIYCGTDFAHS